MTDLFYTFIIILVVFVFPMLVVHGVYEAIWWWRMKR